MPVLLVVDDDELVLESLEATFEDDFVVHKAGSAERAREIVSAHRIDVVISDDRLPRESGVEFLGWLAEEQPRAIRILLTGYFSEPGDVVRAINQGRVWHYMRKPWEAGSMANIIERALESQRRGEALQRAEARYRDFFSSLPVGLFEVDLDGNLLTWNAAFSSSLGGWPAGRPSLADCMADGVWEQLVQGRGTGAAHRSQLVQLDCFDGTPRSLNISLSDTGRPGVLRGTACPGAAGDSSEKDGLIRALHHRCTVNRAALLGLQESRNQLAVLGENLELLASELGHRAEIQEMLQAVQQTAQVIGKVAAIREPWSTEPSCEADQVLARIADFQVGLVSDRRIQLALGLGDRRVAVSANVLRELSIKLLSNALSIGSRHDVEVSTEAADGLARIWFQDQGPGVQPRDAERIFEAGYTTCPPSMGLGLWLARKIAREAGGDVRFVPRDSPGALFLLELPFAD